MIYRLYVKGDEMRARAEAEGRKLQVWSTESDPRRADYSFIMVARDGRWTHARVVQWFTERESLPKARAGYPAGTLLFYSELRSMDDYERVSKFSPEVAP